MTERPRLPPNQQLVASNKWPIIGERTPKETNQPWSLTVKGLTEIQKTFSVEQLSSLPQTEMTIDIHCVTRWSKYDVPIKGVLLKDIFAITRPQSDAKFIAFRSRSNQNHSTSLPIETALEHDCLIALQAFGAPLDSSHGGPIRNFVPGKYFYKSVKWLEQIELLAEDELGYWEADAGYHNNADPWLEERYMSPSIDRREAARLIQSKDFSNRDLRSINASNRDLSGLQAKNAMLRDADFQDCLLVGANFDAANLSNANFRRADLKDASFNGTDVEGANFAEANLDNVSLAGSSLIGASFCDIDESGNVSSAATFTSTTIIDESQLASLSEAQMQFVSHSFKKAKSSNH